MKKHYSTCKEVYSHICNNLDQNLNSQQCREIKRHIDSCPNCVVYLDSLKKTISLYRAYPNPTISSKTHKELLAKLKLSKLK